MKITDFAIDNKYTRWYQSIVNMAATRCSSRKQARTFLGKTEAHHVIPRSIWKSSDNKWVVFLTTKEHFIIHHLLVCMTSGQNRIKMEDALSQFSQGRTLTAKQASICMEYKHRPFTTKRCNAISNARLRTSKKECQYCSKIVDPGNYAQFHGEKCRKNPDLDPSELERRSSKKRESVLIAMRTGTFRKAKVKHGDFTCPHCTFRGSNWGVMNRWHFSRCKTLGSSGNPPRT